MAAGARIAARPAWWRLLAPVMAALLVLGPAARDHWRTAVDHIAAPICVAGAASARGAAAPSVPAGLPSHHVPPCCLLGCAMGGSGGGLPPPGVAIPPVPPAVRGVAAAVASTDPSVERPSPCFAARAPPRFA